MALIFPAKLRALDDIAPTPRWLEAAKRDLCAIQRTRISAVLSSRGTLDADGARCADRVNLRPIIRKGVVAVRARRVGVLAARGAGR